MRVRWLDGSLLLEKELHDWRNDATNKRPNFALVVVVRHTNYIALCTLKRDLKRFSDGLHCFCLHLADDDYTSILEYRADWNLSQLGAIWPGHNILPLSGQYSQDGSPDVTPRPIPKWECCDKPFLFRGIISFHSSITLKIPCFRWVPLRSDTGRE